MTLLTTRVTERRGPYQGLACIRPTVRMGVMGVVHLKIVIQTGFEVLDCTEITALQKPTGQDAKPQLNLVEPGAMFRRKVEHMLMARIAQEGTPLSPAVQMLGNIGHVTPLGDPPADLKAPVGIEIINHPVISARLKVFWYNICPYPTLCRPSPLIGPPRMRFLL